MGLPSLHSHPARRAWHRSSTTPAGAPKDGGAAAPKQRTPPDPPGRSAHQRRLTNGIAVATVLSVLMGALILAGLALATALLPGPRDPLLTLVPAAVGILVLICFHALRTITGGARQHGQIGTAVRATAVTVTDTERLLRRPSWRLAGAMAYLGADMAVLWISFEATGVAPPSRCWCSPT